MLSLRIMLKRNGFTIVELLVVIVVVGILASITVVAYGGIRDRAAAAKRESDLTTLYKAIYIGRKNTGQTMGEITGSYFSLGLCINYLNYNPDDLEPRLLEKSHPCWVRYYAAIDNLSAASGMNLENLKQGDARGNPYSFDENEGEQTSNPCRADTIVYFNGSGTSRTTWKTMPFSLGQCL
jgi:prepilin-type N-terminal cleavage/methylation domain-containing protein